MIWLVAYLYAMGCIVTASAASIASLYYRRPSGWRLALGIFGWPLLMPWALVTELWDTVHK